MEIETQVQQMKSVFGDLFAKMVSFALEDEFEEILGESLVCFYNLQEGEEYEFNPSNEFLFLSWFLFDDTDADDRALVDDFLEQFSEELSMQEMQICRALKETCLSLMQVIEVVPGVSIRLRDVLLGEEFDVLENMGSESIIKGSLLFSRVLKLGEFRFLVGAGVFLDTAVLEPLAKFVTDRYRSECEGGSLLSFRDFLKTNGELIQWWIRAFEQGRELGGRKTLDS